MRKYWAKPLRNEIMHEIGIRILIRKVQLIAAQYEKALLPIYSFSKDHYYRVFFQCEKSKSQTDEILQKHVIHNGAGPLWAGQLWDKELAKKVAHENSQHDLSSFLKTIADESCINTLCFFDIHECCSRKKINPLPQLDEVISELRKKGHQASRTHFREHSIRTDASSKDVDSAIVAALKRKKGK